MKKINLPLCLLAILFALAACNSARPATDTDGNQVDTAYGSQDAKTYTGNARQMRNDRLIDGDIIDMLRRTPGLRVTGNSNNAQVTVVGTPVTQMTTMTPLFVIDGMRIGHDISAVIAAVNINDVSRITVLRDPADTGIYGLDGTNGVIVIKTKKQ